MSYIYKITNNVTGMSYVGNTSYDIQKRWKEHCNDSRKARCKYRSLYAAMNQYGLENFSISILDECTDTDANERETFWIKELNTYENGYNDTTGGAGKPQVDYGMVVSVYKSTKNQRETARILGISNDSVYKILKKMSVETYPMTDAVATKKRSLLAFDNDGNAIAGFVSAVPAAKWICDKNADRALCQESVRKSIQKACTGKYKQAYGYGWKYADTV